MKKFLIYLVLFILIFPNIPILGTEILRNVDGDYFRYSNNDASFTYVRHIDIFSPWPTEKEHTDASIITSNENYPKEHRQIYRLYKINPLCFWRWRYYLSVSKFYEYKSWDEIEPNRVPFDKKNMWQRF